MITSANLPHYDTQHATNALGYVVCIVVSFRQSEGLCLQSLEPHTVGGCLQTPVQVEHCLQGGGTRQCDTEHNRQEETCGTDSPSGALLSLSPHSLAPKTVLLAVIPPTGVEFGGGGGGEGGGGGSWQQQQCSHLHPL